MKADALAIDEFIVHQPPMRLLDRIVSISENDALAETIVRPDNPFFEPGRGLPAYVGLEMMAQAIAAIDGQKRSASGLPANIGFLLGCRRYVSKRASFAENEKLTVVGVGSVSVTARCLRSIVGSTTRKAPCRNGESECLCAGRPAGLSRHGAER